jgi:hypothetical protein
MCGRYVCVAERGRLLELVPRPRPQSVPPRSWHDPVAKAPGGHTWDQARTVRLSTAHAPSLTRAASWLRPEQSWIIGAVTSRVGEAGTQGGRRADAGRTQGGQSRPAPQLVLGYLSLWHSIRASARTALAYSNIRRIWWPLAYLDLPLLFLLFSGVLALQP